MSTTITGYNLDYTGPEVDGLLDKIDDLGNATTSKAGLMSPTDKASLDSAPVEALTNTEIENLINNVTL